MASFQKYPKLASSGNRGCYLFGPVCDTYPCRHVGSHDPDWLADVEDMLEDDHFHTQYWFCFRNRHEEKCCHSLINTGETECEAKFDRCQRINDKRSKIYADMADHRNWELRQLRSSRKAPLRPYDGVGECEVLLNALTLSTTSVETHAVETHAESKSSSKQGWYRQRFYVERRII
jgi:hypothetical protein